MGIVKAIKISTQRKLLIVAADKFLIMWDLVGLTKISEFKAEHEIKCLELSEGGDLLFAGTKSTGTSVADPGALLIFDEVKKSHALWVFHAARRFCPHSIPSSKW